MGLQLILVFKLSTTTKSTCLCRNSIAFCLAGKVVFFPFFGMPDLLIPTYQPWWAYLWCVNFVTGQFGFVARLLCVCSFCICVCPVFVYLLPVTKVGIGPRLSLLYKQTVRVGRLTDAVEFPLPAKNIVICLSIAQM